MSQKKNLVAVLKDSKGAVVDAIRYDTEYSYVLSDFIKRCVAGDTILIIEGRADPVEEGTDA